jgi:predicted membrane-bound spermidine synthase
MQRLWSLRRAGGIGTIAGLLAVLLWPFASLFGPLMLCLFMLAAAVSALCGFSILLMTIHDMATRPRRGSRIRPLRFFDATLATILLVLSWFELHDAIGMFPA